MISSSSYRHGRRAASFEHLLDLRFVSFVDAGGEGVASLCDS